MQFHFHANQSHFHKNGFALRLALKQRHMGTQKWPINPKLYSVGVPIKFPWKRHNFVECTIKNHTSFSYNSWIIGTRDFENSQIALPKGSCNFENFQNHLYILIMSCTEVMRFPLLIPAETEWMTNCLCFRKREQKHLQNWWLPGSFY